MPANSQSANSRPADPSTSVSTNSVWRTAWTAVSLNRTPALALWAFGTLLIACYYWIPSFTVALEVVGKYKTHYGLAFSAVSTGIFGGLAPLFFSQLIASGKSGGSGDTNRLRLGYTVSNFLFWAVKGVEVDLWYRFQAYLFGSDPTLAAVAGKTFLDQVIYVPLFGLWTAILFYQWRDAGYRWPLPGQILNMRWYRQDVFPTLVTNWFVWIPAVVMIYSLPVPLQLPIQNLILCLWVLMLAYLTDLRTGTEFKQQT